MTKEQALDAIKTAPFPAAAEGDAVLFEGYWFNMVNEEWVLDDNKEHPGDQVVETPPYPEDQVVETPPDLEE
jgi:hypothetical protein